MEEAATDNKEVTPRTWSKYVFIALAVIAVLIYLAASGWGGYVYAYVRCGIRQPLIASSFDHSKIYYTPDNRRYSAPGEGISFREYYCTEPQAQKDGFLRAGP